MSLYTQKLKLSLVTCLMTTSLIGTGLAGAAGPQQPSEAGSQVFPAQQEQQVQQDSQHKKVKKDKEKYSQDQKSKKHEESKPKNETQKPAPPTPQRAARHTSAPGRFGSVAAAWQ